jgi:hypothetical protein
MMIPLPLLAASLAAGQPAASALEAKPIVIEGVRERKQAIRDFVSALTPSHIGGQLSRFQTAVCPAAIGLSPEQNRAVVERLRVVASAIGIKVGRVDCAPNLLVAAAFDKEEFVAELKKFAPGFFADPIDAGVRIRRDDESIAWHLTGLMNEDRVVAPILLDEKHGGRKYLVSSTESSRLRPAAIPWFAAGVLVVDARALAGLTTMQFADYAALRLYVDTDPRRLKPTAPSILGVLAAPMGASTPPSLTEWDLAFLKGLYRSDDRQYANRQRGEIEHAVDRSTQPPPPEQ